jgi:hypothetical protein
MRTLIEHAHRGVVTWGIVTWGIVTWAVVGMCFPSEAMAQIAPDTPRLVSPHGSRGLGVHWVRAETLPGDDEAVLVTWAFPGLPDGVRLRGGAGTGVAGETAVFGGLDVQAPLLRGDSDAPFDLDWQSGVGVSVGEYTLVTVPVGLTGGISWTSGSVWLAPYVTAGLAADLRLGDEAPAEEFEVGPALDLGVDLSLDRERMVVFRAAASLGDRQALSLGIALGSGR